MAKVIEIADSHEEAAKADKAFWATQTPQARLRHTFELR
ncbi:MAG: hypothetical protein RIR87_1772, partial [Actinomycetota bacterium]